MLMAIFLDAAPAIGHGAQDCAHVQNAVREEVSTNRPALHSGGVDVGDVDAKAERLLYWTRRASGEALVIRSLADFGAALTP